MNNISPPIPATTRLRLDSEALLFNWRALDQMSGVASAGAAVKANAYGLGVREVVTRLQTSGCKHFYVANWQEAQEIDHLATQGTHISVLNGVREEDMPYALLSKAKPVLNTAEQVNRWSQTNRPCDVMINSGMNRLGLNMQDIQSTDLAALNIDIVMSHLASADEDVAQNQEQLAAFQFAIPYVSGKRRSFANSAGIVLGTDYHFDCTRPGLSLYGGKPRAELQYKIKQVAFPQAQIVQVRKLCAGDKLGYNAQYIAQYDHWIAILAIGYADGYLRGFSGKGVFMSNGNRLPVVGRVSMDLTAIDISAASDLTEGDWVDCEYDLPIAAQQSGLSQYELLTGLGNRLERYWR